jgi:GNAT superfamily N-acetyltransferase
VSLQTTTDHDVIAAQLEIRLNTDPVRGTVLGTILHSLNVGAWCAWTPDGRALAVRSAMRYPVLLDGPWDVDGPELAVELRALPDLAGVSGPVEQVTALLSELPPVRGRTDLRLFRLSALVRPATVAGFPRRAEQRDQEVLEDWVAAFHAEAGGFGEAPRSAVERAITAGGAWLWCDPTGTAVSTAWRRAAVAGSARIGPVYTPAEHRGRGYGSAVTAAATQDVLNDGAVPVLFTDLANATSNHIYRELGYTPVEDRVEIQLA